MMGMGEVVSVEDPLREGRVQVRVFGVTDDKKNIPDKELAWYPTMMPSSSPSIAGAGQTHALEVGSKVCVMFADEEQRSGIVMGSIYPGTQSPNSLPPLFKGLKEKGPPIPKGFDLGPMGDINIIDKIGNFKQTFSKLLGSLQFFKNLLP